MLKKCAPDKAAGIRETIAKLQEEKKISGKKLKEKANSQKYHLVRFVERQKLCRKISSIENKLRADSSLSAS